MDRELLQKTLWESYCLETAHATGAHDRSDINRAAGHCAITALLVQDILGGHILKAEVTNYGFGHFRNEIDGEQIDFTLSQFGEPPLYANIKEASRDKLLADQDTVHRYFLLKQRFEKLL